MKIPMMMIIGIGLCRIGTWSFLSLKQLHHVLHHDNYKWSFGQQLCVRMTNFCTSSFALFFSFFLSLSTLILAVVVHMDNTRLTTPSSTTNTLCSNCQCQLTTSTSYLTKRCNYILTFYCCFLKDFHFSHVAS